ncbi:Ldh family oxidoreductase [Desulfospira joergensenii]|uniref:Ldh family oxidoreductase n=1 Tax=Desulfospira joergensenii TaxID=53329 RepID=UPI00041C8992|nr:Ldh family oxidoreductase [Desulfospira joergensenii]
MIHVMSQTLETFIKGILSKLGVPEDHGTMTAKRLVAAHMRGFDTHGIPCLIGYVDALDKGRIKSAPALNAETLSPWLTRVDGDNGLGQVAGTTAMEACLKSADTFGIGCAVVRRSNHFGAASAYSLMALEHDCIGIVTSNASAVTAPFGAAERLLGTNPLSVAVPAGKNPAFVIDMATSEGAMKKVRKALEEGKSIPPGWALDENGRKTIDPEAALKGVMLPFGGVKGSGITILTDILSGVLSGANFGGRVLSVFTNQERESGNGNFMLAIKVASLMPMDEFKARMDEELDRIMALKPAKGVEKVAYPGFFEHQTQVRRIKEGIPLERKLVEKMSRMGNEHGVLFPSS